MFLLFATYESKPDCSPKPVPRELAGVRYTNGLCAPGLPLLPIYDPAPSVNIYPKALQDASTDPPVGVRNATLPRSYWIRIRRVEYGFPRIYALGRWVNSLRKQQQATFHVTSSMATWPTKNDHLAYIQTPNYL
jgi:hypothetical protein